MEGSFLCTLVDRLVRRFPAYLRQSDVLQPFLKLTDVRIRDWPWRRAAARALGARRDGQLL
jgi:hypothetical protein